MTDVITADSVFSIANYVALTAGGISAAGIPIWGIFLYILIFIILVILTLLIIKIFCFNNTDIGTPS